MEVEREKERQRLETARKLEAARASYEQEHDDARKQVTSVVRYVS